MRFRGTLAARVTLLATVAVALSVAAVATAAYLTVKHQLVAALDHSLVDRATAAAGDPTLTDLTRDDVPSWVLGAADVRIAVVYADGRLETSDADRALSRPIRLDPRDDPEFQVARGETPQSLRTVWTDDGPVRIAAVPGNEPGSALILAQSLESTHEALGRLGVVLTVFGLAGVIAAAFAGRAVARNGLRPVRRLSDEVEEIARTEDLHPVSVAELGNADDEIARLATAFNTLIATVVASRDRQRRLVADAGHELRTPLTSLRTNLDLLAQAEARGGLEPRARAELLADVRFQIDELTTLIGDLTELARDEAIAAQLEELDLAEVVERAVERVRRRATGLGFDVVLAPWDVVGEPASLERAVINLLDNAAKWSPPGGTVTVRLEQGVLSVVDEGPGIPAEDLPHVFERFYRSTDARTMPGSGLGLSIVRQVVERHGGEVRAGTAAGHGAALWVRLPGTGASSVAATGRPAART